MFSGNPNGNLALLISIMTKLVHRAGMDRILGGRPGPTLKASFQVPQLSSNAN